MYSQRTKGNISGCFNTIIQCFLLLTSAKCNFKIGTSPVQAGLVFQDNVANLILTIASRWFHLMFCLWWIYYSIISQTYWRGTSFSEICHALYPPETFCSEKKKCQNTACGCCLAMQITGNLYQTLTADGRGHGSLLKSSMLFVLYLPLGCACDLCQGRWHT